jgi:lactate permease
MFTAPGTLIFLSVLLAYGFYRAKSMWPKGGGRTVLNRTMKQAIGATLTVMTMSMMAVVMMETGMTSYLANGMARYFGNAYAIVSPFIGVLGAFMTGSNTNSNILFTGLQREVASLLSISPFVILGLQTTGGAIGNMFCPLNVALGTGVTNTVGREGECLRATALYTVVQGLFVGILAWLMLYVLAPGME